MSTSDRFTPSSRSGAPLSNDSDRPRHRQRRSSDRSDVFGARGDNNRPKVGTDEQKSTERATASRLRRNSSKISRSRADNRATEIRSADTSEQDGLLHVEREESTQRVERRRETE